MYSFCSIISLLQFWLLNLIQNEILGSSIEDFKEASEERRAMAPLPEGRNLFSYRCWHPPQSSVWTLALTSHFPFLGLRGTTLSMSHSPPTVSAQCLPKVKSCSGSHPHSYECVLMQQCDSGVQGKLRARSPKFLSKFSTPLSCRTTSISIWYLLQLIQEWLWHIIHFTICSGVKFKGGLEQSKCFECWTWSLCLPLVSLHQSGAATSAKTT